MDLSQVAQETAMMYGGDNQKVVGAALEILAKELSAESQRPMIETREKAIAYLRLLLSKRTEEHLYVFYIGANGRVLLHEEFSRGTADQTVAYPGQIIRRALDKGAAGVILAHNHPAGVASPSKGDKSLTLRVRAALKLVEIELLDHFIVAEDGVYSMGEHGDLDFERSGPELMTLLKLIGKEIFGGDGDASHIRVIEG